MAQMNELYPALATQTIFLGRINVLLVLVSSWDFSDNKKKYRISSDSPVNRENFIKHCYSGEIIYKMFQNDYMHCINRTLSLSVLLSTNKWSSTCPSTSCLPTSDRKSTTIMSTDTRARCLMRRAFWENSASLSER